MKRLVTFVVTALLTCLIAVFPAEASEPKITCESASCVSENIAQLFSEHDIWYPGKSTTKKIQFINNSILPRIITIHANQLASEGDLDTVINITVSNNTKTFFTGTMRDFFIDKNISLLTLPMASEEIYFSADMDKNAGNEFQGKKTVFDLLFSIQDDTNPTPTPPTQNTSSGGEDNKSENIGGIPSGPAILGAKTDEKQGILGTYLRFAPIASANNTLRTDKDDVAGITALPTETGSTQCKTFPYWPLLLVIEALAILALRHQYGKQTSKKFIYSFITAGVTGIIIYLLVCINWYVLLAGIPLLFLLRPQLATKK